jgi:hypothetical protein
LNTGRNDLAGTGTSTAALAIGGLFHQQVQATETWNGTNWTEVNAMNSNRTELTGAGIQTSAIAFGGGTPGLETETWNGTNWTATTNLSYS